MVVPLPATKRLLLQASPLGVALCCVTLTTRTTMARPLLPAMPRYRCRSLYFHRLTSRELRPPPAPFIFETSATSLGAFHRALGLRIGLTTYSIRTTDGFVDNRPKFANAIRTRAPMIITPGIRGGGGSAEIYPAQLAVPRPRPPLSEKRPQESSKATSAAALPKSLLPGAFHAPSQTHESTMLSEPLTQPS